MLKWRIKISSLYAKMENQNPIVSNASLPDFQIPSKIAIVQNVNVRTC